MGQALYRNYRPRSFDDVVGQEHIIKTLRNAIKTGRVSHAYLFTGPRGVGKTSVARILAHEINGLKYIDESIHLDIIEIDAASNRRIDEIRELRERVHIAPTSAKYKVYIIDEVHMLTREAFNALLKTLEEPPAHCIFILATTEVHKLPATIISRTQHFSFKPIDKSLAEAHLNDLAKSEKIDIDSAALSLLAEHGEGSLRDSISLLDQLGAKDHKINQANVEQMIGLPRDEAVRNLLTSIETGNNSGAIANLDDLKEVGVNAALLAKAINQQLRAKLMIGRAETWVIELLRNLSKVAASSTPQEELEIDILEATNNNATSLSKPTRSADLKSADTLELHEETLPPEPPADIMEDPETLPAAPKEPKKPTSNNGSFSLNDWPEVVAKTKSEAASIYTALRLATPRLDGDDLFLAFQFPLHQKKLNQAKSIDLLGQIIEDLFNVRLNIKAIIDKSIDHKSVKPAPVKQSPLPPPKTPELQTISNIFGTAEVLES